MKEELYLYFTGTAGAGKSSLTRGFDTWARNRGLDAIKVNLDPGATNLPYTPDVDIRDWVALEEVMAEHGLGPNGAQIAAADMVALNLREVKDAIEDYKADYVLVDTPGQVELFVFRQAGKVIVETLNPGRSMVAFLLDPALARTPSSFVSQLLLTNTVHYRLHTPMVAVLSKKDLLSAEDEETIRSWAGDADALYAALSQEGMGDEEGGTVQALPTELLRALGDIGGFHKLIATSSDTLEGMDDLYVTLQQAFLGGEDTMSD